MIADGRYENVTKNKTPGFLKPAGSILANYLSTYLHVYQTIALFDLNYCAGAAFFTYLSKNAMLRCIASANPCEMLWSLPG